MTSLRRMSLRQLETERRACENDLWVKGVRLGWDESVPPSADRLIIVGEELERRIRLREQVKGCQTHEEVKHDG